MLIIIKRLSKWDFSTLSISLFYLSLSFCYPKIKIFHDTPVDYLCIIKKLFFLKWLIEKDYSN